MADNERLGFGRPAPHISQAIPEGHTRVYRGQLGEWRDVESPDYGRSNWYTTNYGYAYNYAAEAGEGSGTPYVYYSDISNEVLGKAIKEQPDYRGEIKWPENDYNYLLPHSAVENNIAVAAQVPDLRDYAERELQRTETYEDWGARTEAWRDELPNEGRWIPSGPLPEPEDLGLESDVSERLERALNEPIQNDARAIKNFQHTMEGGITDNIQTAAHESRLAREEPDVAVAEANNTWDELTAEGRKRWADAGFDRQAAEHWMSHGFVGMEHPDFGYFGGPAAAKEWRNAGVSNPKEALKYQELGIRPSGVADFIQDKETKVVAEAHAVAESVSVTAATEGEVKSALAKDTIAGKLSRSVLEKSESAATKATDHVFQFITKRPGISAAIAGTIGLSLLLRHRSMPKSVQEGPQVDNPPLGEPAMYGYINGDSTYIQMNGAGYDNSYNQTAGNNISWAPKKAGFNTPSMSGGGYRKASRGNRVTDYRHSNSSVNMDSQLSRMV